MQKKGQRLGNEMAAGVGWTLLWGFQGRLRGQVGPPARLPVMGSTAIT
ncbi:hypothetical protein C4K04_1026 [Pseudomonas chlororaphis]|uniref:Uncharacterized protein n=1 Tax=Pseudomonas chlororaphis TaxID=587753 RepID=A0A3G7TJ97_9PSED|nr:hypothetical protein C4K04_1026 [Pseudomonas chlororaphis]